MLEQVTAEIIEPELADLDTATLRELSRLVPALRDRVEPATDMSLGPADQYVLFGALRDLLTSLAARWPVVIILDDLHWADRPTLLLMRHLVGSMTGEGVLLLGTYRETEVPALERLASTVSTIKAPAGTTLVTEGDHGDRYYLIVDGLVHISRGGVIIRRSGPARRSARSP